MKTIKEMKVLVDHADDFYDDTRKEYIAHHGWWIHTSEICDYISMRCKGLRTLEVGCGSGLLSNYLSSNGVNVISVDIEVPTYTFETYYPVEKKYSMEGDKAVDKFKPQIVIMAWPDYDDPYAYKVLKECLKHNIPILYIGELGGCNGDGDFDEFLNDHWDIDYLDDAPEFLTWDGLHDELLYFTPKEE